MKLKSTHIFLGISLAIVFCGLPGNCCGDIFTNANGLGIDPVITFDEFGLGDKDGTEWQALTGITFSSFGLGTDDFDVFPGIDGANLIGNTDGQELSILFDDPISRFAMAWITNSGQTTYTAYLGNDFVEQAILITDFTDPAIAFTVFENITFDRLELEIDATFSSFRIDNVQRVVPEPGSFTFLASIAGLVFVRRKRQNA